MLGLVLEGCGASKEAQNASGTSGFNEELKKYEADFRPSDYDAEPAQKTAMPEERPTVGPSIRPEILPTSTPELVQGFRVQIFSSANIDEAKARKGEAEAMFPGEWFYLEYDPPTYKVRAGNFLNRFEADRFAKLLVERGYQDAWTVPQKVYRQNVPK